MKRSYEIKSMTDCGPEGKLWDAVPPALVDCFPWAELRPEWGGDYQPETMAQMVFCGDSFRVRLRSAEPAEMVRTTQEGYGGLVYTDSCLELFFMPDPEHSARYLNWEFNPAGAMYLTLGTDRFDRNDVVLPEYRELFEAEPSRDDQGWEVSWRIPLEFLREYFPQLEPGAGWRMRGNFYKCGDRAPRPHYGCWSPIDLPEPDFHSPAFFGDFIIGG